MNSDRQHLRDSSSENRAQRPLVETTSQAWIRHSVWLHIASIVIAAIYIIIAGTTQLHKYGYTLVGFFSLVGIAPQALAFLFSLSELVARRMRPSGWHPGVHIGLSLLLWLAGLAYGIMFSVFWTSFNDWRQLDGGDWEEGCPEHDSLSGECWGVVMLPQFMVELLLMFALAVMHFALFVGAIQQLKKVKAERKAAAGTV